MVEHGAGIGGQAVGIALDRRRQLARRAGAQPDERLQLRAGNTLGFGLAVGAKKVHRRHHMRAIERHRGLEIATVKHECRVELVGREMAGEGIGQS